MKKFDVKTYIFDLDGTLFDSFNMWQKVDEIFFKRRKMSIPAGYQEQILHMDLKEAAEFTKNNYLKEEREEDILKEWELTAKKIYTEEVKLKDCAAELIYELKKRKKKISIATSSSREIFVDKLEKEGIAQYFDKIVCSGDEGLKKSDPEFFSLAALGEKGDDVVVFDDLAKVLKTVKKLGFKTVAMKGFLNDEEELIESSDLYIENFNDFFKYI